MKDVLQSAIAGTRGEAAASVALRRILWACDFSTCSLDALRWVIPLARAFESEVTALHVMPTRLPPGGGPLSLTNPALLQPHLHHDISAALDRYLGPAAAANVATRVALREGKPVHEILDVAEALRADLIAVGTHGRSAFERSVIGSVAEGVLGRAPCPVLTVPGAETETAPSASGGMPKLLLWATDFSSHATVALSYAQAIASKGVGHLVLLHVVEPDTLTDDRERVRTGEQRLRAVAMGDEMPAQRVERIVAFGGAPAEILRIARERKAGLIVMGTHGSRTLHSILFGSTARRVIRDAPCPVLAVRRA